MLKPKDHEDWLRRLAKAITAMARGSLTARGAGLRYRVTPAYIRAIVAGFEGSPDGVERYYRHRRRLETQRRRRAACGELLRLKAKIRYRQKLAERCRAELAGAN